MKPIENKFLQALLIFAGTLSLSIGILGIFLPLLPTTVFLLMSAWCYTRSSPKLYNWLITNKYFGVYFRNYREKRGIPMKAKIVSISLLWLSIGYSITIVSMIWVKILLFAIAVGVTIHLVMLKTYRPENIENIELDTN